MNLIDYKKYIEKKIIILKKIISEQNNKSKFELEQINRKIQFLSELKNLQPRLRYKSKRGIKFIYGEMFWYTTNFESVKKSFRIPLGKINDKYSRKELEKRFIDIYLQKVMNNTSYDL
ncbi:MAG: hypothetical protein VX770_08005 [Candidatus Neomarinimicrobiota bacterium]|jgi:hypothetical protein|nr:hypothetical protein [Candidatus Neomarinimicrobiota bacterium]